LSPARLSAVESLRFCNFPHPLTMIPRVLRCFWLSPKSLRVGVWQMYHVAERGRDVSAETGEVAIPGVLECFSARASVGRDINRVAS
jgi:hypothetical protein